MILLGVMTGTSCDGMDAVCVEFSGDSSYPNWKIHWSASLAYPRSLRDRVLKLQMPKRTLTLKAFLELDRDLGEWYGKSLQSLIAKHPIKPDVVANHGQTVAHFPESASTLQMGDPTRIAHATGLTVISHFREGDMAAGGQGAPLLPLFHKMLATQLPKKGEGVAIHNLGGISNLTYVHPDGTLLAFDTGPSNIWIDEAIEIVTRGKKKFDKDGDFARAGEPDMKAVQKILKLPYFKKAQPKSTGRDDFPFKLLRSVTRARGADLVATATWITVESIADAYRRFVLDKGFPLSAVYCAGGGGKNRYLVELLAEKLAPARVLPLAQAEIPGLSEQVLEPLGFAMFGYLSMEGKPVGGSWTGAQGFGSPGWITPGQNWARVRSLI